MESGNVVNAGRLYLSFWHVCLDNLPEGRFRHRRISVDEARLSIAAARQAQTLLCLTDVDLAAPYKKPDADRYEALCRMLSEHLAIPLALDDFFSAHDHEGETLYFANALNCVSVSAHSRLLIVTCGYVADEEQTAGKLPSFDIDPESVEFHVIEADE
jgi:hypothetical protein